MPGDPLELGAGTRLGPAYQQAGAEGAVIAAAGNREENRRRQGALMANTGEIRLLALAGSEGIPDEGFEVGIHPVAGVGDTGNFGPSRVFDGHRAQAAGGGAALEQQQGSERYKGQPG